MLAEVCEKGQNWGYSLLYAVALLERYGIACFPGCRRGGVLPERARGQGCIEELKAERAEAGKGR